MDAHLHYTAYLCPYWNCCAFVQQNQKRMPKLISRIKKNYCLIAESACARRLLYETLGEKFVPPLLLPAQTEWAQQIKAEALRSGQLRK